MKTFLVPDMHCEHCVKWIEAVFEKAGIPVSVSLAEHTVTADGDADKAFSLLYDLGFSPTEK